MLKKTMYAVACAITLCATAAFAAETKTTAAPKSTPAMSNAGEKAPAKRAMPYYGTIGKVDKAAKTFTLEGKKSTRTFTITDSTKMEKAGGPATWEDLKSGEYVRGSAMKKAEGQYDAVSVKIGPKEKAPAAANQAEPKSKKQ